MDSKKFKSNISKKLGKFGGYLFPALSGKGKKKGRRK